MTKSIHIKGLPGAEGRWVPEAIPIHHERHETGAWHQIEPINGTKRYDAEYVAKYDALACQEMSICRWRTIISSVIDASHETRRTNLRVLDFGCGNGAFLRMGSSKYQCQKVSGYDIAGYPLPGIEMIGDPRIDKPEFDIVTFFDSLEHVPDIDVLLEALGKARYMVISLPWCHGPSMGPDGAEWFAKWKHNKPDEHLWYFDPVSLCNLMRKHHYKPIFIGNPEDAVRKPVDHLPNILTGIFEKDYSQN